MAGSSKRTSATQRSPKWEAGNLARPGDEAAAGTPGTGENLCPDCGGSGHLDGARCPNCSGTGKIIEGIGGG